MRDCCKTVHEERTVVYFNATVTVMQKQTHSHRDISTTVFPAVSFTITLSLHLNWNVPVDVSASNRGKTNRASMWAQYVVAHHSSHAPLRSELVDAETRQRSDSLWQTDREGLFYRASVLCPSVGRSCLSVVDLSVCRSCLSVWSPSVACRSCLSVCLLPVSSTPQSVEKESFCWVER